MTSAIFQKLSGTRELTDVLSCLAAASVFKTGAVTIWELPTSLANTLGQGPGHSLYGIIYVGWHGQPFDICHGAATIRQMPCSLVFANGVLLLHSTFSAQRASLLLEIAGPLKQVV